MGTINRNTVIVIGDSPLNNSPFEERDLKIEHVSWDEVENRFNDARAIVISDFPGKFALMNKCFSELFIKAEDHGLAQLIIVHSLHDHSQVDSIRKEAVKNIYKREFVSRIYDAKDISKAAEFIARHKIGKPHKNARIEPDEILKQLSKDDILLLKRAFYDCDKIYLEKLSGGVAAYNIFRVFAWIPDSLVGPSPMPFFVKIASIDDIQKEKDKYEYYAEHYIPFHLRPNLDLKRCIQTHSLGALVGNFVGDAVSLRTKLRSDDGSGIIFSLFETSLRGFRLQPFVSKKKPKSNFKDYVNYRIWIEELNKRKDLIKRAKKLGFKSTPGELQNFIESKAEKLSTIVGPHHADLHQGNIMVRGNDAILIDFFSTENDGPLAADPITLEVSLVFSTDNNEKLEEFDSWKTFVDEIYPSKFNTHPPSLSEVKPGPFSWLRRAIRELRHIIIACDSKDTCAKIMLVTYLIRFARFAQKDTSDNLKKLKFDRHAYALVVAERICNSMK